MQAVSVSENVDSVSNLWAMLAQGAPPPSNRWRTTPRLHGMGQTIARIKNNDFTYLHPDHLGSPQAATNRYGNLLWTEHYTPFGETMLNPAANDNQSGFTSHIKDKDTGLNYMQARYYDPTIGRFLSVDPVDFIGSGGNPGYFNRYAYSGNDPINNIDPDGEFFQVVGFALGVASNVAIQTLVEGKSLGEVNVVEALTSGAVGATGLGAVSQGAKAIKAVRGAKQVSKNLKKAQRHAQSRSRRGKDSFKADKKVNRLENEIRGDIKDAVTAVGKAVGTAAVKKGIDKTAPEVTVNDVGEAIGSAVGAVSAGFDKVLENEVNR